MGQATLDCNTCQFTVGLGVTKVGYADSPSGNSLDWWAEMS